MVIKVEGFPFILQFLFESDAAENELRNFAKTHRLELEESEFLGLTIVDEPKPDSKDVNRFLKVLKESGHWVNDIVREKDIDIPILCVMHKELMQA